VRSLPENERGKFHPGADFISEPTDKQRYESGSKHRARSRQVPTAPPNFEYEDPFEEVKKAQDELEKDKKRNEARQAALRLLDQAAKEREQARAASANPCQNE
jgi:hypothetical protein